MLLCVFQLWKGQEIRKENVILLRVERESDEHQLKYTDDLFSTQISSIELKLVCSSENRKVSTF